MFPVKTIDNEDGTFTVSYQPQVRGNHKIEVKIRNRHINGSPFHVNVAGRADFERVGRVMKCFGSEGTGGGKTLGYLFICLFVCLFVFIRFCLFVSHVISLYLLFCSSCLIYVLVMIVSLRGGRVGW